MSLEVNVSAGNRNTDNINITVGQSAGVENYNRNFLPILAGRGETFEGQRKSFQRKVIHKNNIMSVIL